MKALRKNISLSFLIPAYNDETTIEKTVREAENVGKTYCKAFEIIVINDKSPDKTGDVLRKLEKKIPQLRVIHHDKNLGYGGTVRELYYAGAKEWMFTTPGDYQIPPKEVVKLLPFLDKADMIIGHRVNRNDPPDRLRQSHIYNTLLRTLYGITIQDINSVRLMKQALMEKIILTTESAFVDAEFTIQAIKKGFTVIEIPIGHRARDAGEATAGGGKLKTILPVIMDMITFRLKSILS